MSYGPVAQLNRVSDSGSEGSGFEPQRGHKAKLALQVQISQFVQRGHKAKLALQVQISQFVQQGHKRQPVRLPFVIVV